MAGAPERPRAPASEDRHALAADEARAASAIDWTSAGIGAGIALGAVLAAALTVALARRNGRVTAT